MRIYISHSREFDFKKALYEPIQNSELSKHHRFIFPDQALEESFDSKELLVSKQCDLVIAEVSYPATGQGIVLGWADMCGIPIVCIYQQGAEISSDLSKISNKFLMYTDTQNMISDITGVLRNYE